MLAGARERVAAAGLDELIDLVEAQAEALPLEDGAVDALTHTYLLRYVDDPAATLAELARTIRPGGVMASLDFGVPDGGGVSGMEAVDARRPAYGWPSRGPRLGRDRPLPGPEHRAVLGALPAPDLLRDVGQRRHGANPSSAAQLGRRDHHPRHP